MKNKLFRLFGKSALPTLLAGALLAFSSPVSALAQGRGGGGGHSAGRSVSGGSARGFSGGARAYAGGPGYSRGYGGGYYRGGGYGGGLYLGLGAPYAYGPAYGYAPAPCGFYDQAGYWHAGAGCYTGPAGY
jgi:hypothetical protein